MKLPNRAWAVNSITCLISAVAVLPALITIPTPASAQYFGRNKVQYETFEFKVLKTPHFDIHFYPEEGEAVEDAARMGERWYERLARMFQHEFEEPKPLILYADHPDFQQTNTLRGSISEGTGGVTESLKNRVIMPLTGSYSDTDHVLGHELVHAFQYNVAQGRSGVGIQGLSLLPLWLVEGMAEYLSVGREDPLTAMWLRDAIRREELPTIEQMTKERRFFPYRFGQALWAYIGGTYGDEKVVDLYRRSLSAGWEPAIEQVLGISSEDLSIEWRNTIENEYFPLMGGRQAPGESGALLLAPSTGAGKQNVSPSVSPDGKLVAFLSEKDLFSIDLFIADARTGEIKRKLVSANADPHFDALRFVDSAGDWSPDAEKFVFTVFAEGDNELAIVDVSSGNIDMKIDLDDIGAISSPAWSPDGRHIAFSGLKGGVSDIYAWEIESGSLRQLTNDKFSDLQPAWSPDSNNIVFVSDRNKITDFENLQYAKSQIAFVNVSTGDIDTIEIFGNVKHINPQYAPDGRSFYFVSDQDGFSDIYQYEFDTKDIRRITRLSTAVSGITAMSPAISVARQAGTIIFTVFDAFEFHVYSLQAGEANAGGQAVTRYAEKQPGRLLPPGSPTQSSRIANYLSDKQTGLEPTGTFLVENAVDYDSSLSLDFIGQPSLGVGTDRFGSYVGGGASAFFSDMLGNRSLGVSLQANGTYKDIGGQVFYLNQAKRLNWGASAGRIPYMMGYWTYGTDAEGYSYQGLLRQRISVAQTSLLFAYPFSTTRRIEGNIGVQRWSFDLEEDRYYFTGLGSYYYDVDRVTLAWRDPINLASASIAFVGDNSITGFTSPVDGGRFRLELGPTLGQLNFASVVADFRRYFPLTRNLTFAARGLHFGRYGSQLDTNRSTAAIQPYFLGWETFVRGYSYESITPQECEVASIEPGSVAGNCPVFDRLFGHRLAVANLEMRIPLFGTPQFGLLEFSYLPTELLFFADAGMAWNNIEEVELDFVRSSGKRVPVFSAGAGARFNIMGFLVLEVYYAYPFQRPTKGPHWGFLLSPGW